MPSPFGPLFSPLFYLALSPADTSLPATVPETKAYSFSYRTDTLRGKDARTRFEKTFSEKKREVIYALNRIHPSVVKPGRVLVVPDSLSDNLLDYAPFPSAIAAFDTLPKMVLVSFRMQAFGLYEKGKLIRWGPVSSGKKATPTPPGMFHATFREKRRVSSENKDWVLPWYVGIFANRGVAFHQYHLPGYPASHACIRLQEPDAMWIYNWMGLKKPGYDKKKDPALLGTPIILFGKYNHEEKAPWLTLAETGEPLQINEAEMEEIMSYLPELHKEFVVRNPADAKFRKASK